MSEPEEFWISGDDLIEINLLVGGTAAGVRDLNGVHSNAARPFTSPYGMAGFPTIWDKAACLLHSIASTQYFTEGNKRTAWEACRHYLQYYGETLAPMPWMNKGAGIMSAAVDALSIQEIAQWLYVNRMQAKNRINFAAFGIPVPLQNKMGFAHVLPAQIQILHPGQKTTHVSIVTRIYWDRIDLGLVKKVSVRLVPIGDSEFTVRDSSTQETVATVEGATADPAFERGMQGWHDEFILVIDVNKPGRAQVQILIDDEVAWTDYLTISVRDEVPDVATFSV